MIFVGSAVLVTAILHVASNSHGAIDASQLRGTRRSNTPLTGRKNSIPVPRRPQTEIGPLVLVVHAGLGDRVVQAIDCGTASGTTGGQSPPTQWGPGAASIARLTASAAFSTTHWILAVLLLRAVGSSGPTVGFLASIAVLISAVFLETYAVANPWRTLRHRMPVEAEAR